MFSLDASKPRPNSSVNLSASRGSNFAPYSTRSAISTAVAEEEIDLAATNQLLVKIDD